MFSEESNAAFLKGQALRRKQLLAEREINKTKPLGTGRPGIFDRPAGGVFSPELTAAFNREQSQRRECEHYRRLSEREVDKPVVAAKTVADKKPKPKTLTRQNLDEAGPGILRRGVELHEFSRLC